MELTHTMFVQRFSGVLSSLLLLVGFALCLVSASPSQAAEPSSRELNSGWQFRAVANAEQAAVKEWHPARVPGVVQTDLLDNKLIADPFDRDNEFRLQWIGLADWEYRTTLNVDAATLTHEHVDLVFEGLDTYATVRLNGQQILEADNMFRRWRVPVKGVLHSGANELTVSFASPIRRLLPGTLKRAYQLPGEFDSAFGEIGRAHV